MLTSSSKTNDKGRMMTNSQLHAQINTLTVRAGLAYHASKRTSGQRSADNLTFARAAYSRAAFLRSKIK